MTPEGKMKARIKELLLEGQRHGTIYSFMPVQSGFGQATIDYLCCMRGRFVGIEAKRPGVNKLTSRQELIRERIINAGGTFFLVNDDKSLAALAQWMRGKKCI